MERNRQSKIIAIVALCVAVVGLTLGFAAFSNTLTISSSATVTPDESDFKMVIYGVEDITKFDYNNYSPIDSTTMSNPEVTTGASATNAIIDNSLLTIKNLNATLVKKGDVAVYTFRVANEGKYDAYMARTDLEAIYNMNQNKTCTADPGTSDVMVQAACKEIEFALVAFPTDYEYLFDSSNIAGSSDYIKISPNESIIMEIHILYASGNTLADGNFTVNFGDVKLNFSTVEPTI